MTCKFSDFDAKVFEFDMSVPYKYVVHSPKEKEEDDCYEYLHAYSGEKDYNRCLRIPQDKLKTLIGGMYKWLSVR